MDIKDLQKKVIEFRDRRDWAKYHNPKDLAISLSLETAELLEIFQWKSPWCRSHEMDRKSVRLTQSIRDEGREGLHPW